MVDCSSLPVEKRAKLNDFFVLVQHDAILGR
jgi:hypothetical protein